MGGLFAAGYLGKDIMQAGIGRQMDLTGLEVLVGKQKGDVLNAQLLDFAKRSIYGNEVFNEGKIMAGSGVKAGNIMPVLKMIGDIAMGDKERMKSIALAFSEASSTGYLTGRQELMMRTALFNPLESLSKMTGKSGGDLKKDMEKGKIGIDMLVKSMEYATGPMGRWHNMMEKMQDTPAGKWTAFTGTIRTLAGNIGLFLLPALWRCYRFFIGHHQQQRHGGCGHWLDGGRLGRIHGGYQMGHHTGGAFRGRCFLAVGPGRVGWRRVREADRRLHGLFQCSRPGSQ